MKTVQDFINEGDHKFSDSMGPGKGAKHVTLTSIDHMKAVAPHAHEIAMIKLGTHPVKAMQHADIKRAMLNHHNKMRGLHQGFADKLK